MLYSRYEETTLSDAGFGSTALQACELLFY